MNVQDLSEKRVVAWGGDITFRKCLEVAKLPIECIVDNNEKKWGGGDFLGFKINAPAFLESSKSDNLVIIIFCFHFSDIKDQLESMGFEFGKNVFHFLDIEEYKCLIDGITEEDDYLFLDNIIQPGWTCLDIGANCGIFTYKLSKLTGGDGMVYSFEPQPKTFGELSRIKTNYDLANVKVFNMALVDNVTTKSIQMVIPEVNGMSRSGLAHIIKDDESKDHYLADETFEKLFGKELSQDALNEGQRIQVKSSMLDSMCRELGITKVDFMKIDVEGAELIVINGALETIGKDKPFIQLELGFSYFGKDVHQKLIDLLKEIGYTFSYLENGSIHELEGFSLIPGEHNYYFVPPKD